MWTRGGWLAWFSLVTFSTIITYTLTRFLATLLRSRASLSPTLPEFDSSLPPTSSGGRHRPAPTGVKAFVKRAWKGKNDLERRAVAFLDRRVFERTEDARIRWLEGVGWAVVGGSLAGGCLVFTKCV